jgi:hypothetical protein
MALQNLDDVIGDYTGMVRTVLDYSALMKRMVHEAKKPGFTVDSWGPLAELIDTANFVRVGNFKEVMNWQDYIGFLTSWASSSEWDCSFKRVTESGNVVFLELEERSQIGTFSNSVNSASVYEFNDGGTITRIDVYLQMALPDPEMLASYSSVEISE